jgi:hypothetical protein
MYGNAGSGAIAIYTRRGGDVSSKPGSGMAASTVVGYSPIREFYSPNYSTFVRAHEQRDVRTTLFWKPQLTTAKNENKVTVVFYNTDVFSKALRVVVEGMTRDGQFTHFEQIME